MIVPHHLLSFFALALALFSIPMCNYIDTPKAPEKDPWDSVLNQKMPLTDCAEEMRDSSIYFSERLMALEQIARIQKRKQMYIQPDPAYNVIFRYKQ